ncbi:hypothetical protein U4E84_05515 [Halorubrum sp. AD140]|uniref:hypothetical protein n=1 Tax=Halorubrum sp. AD140 TaxID=3050073 RepID=UPI002ACC6078|nr:hypothetical protein [Halorubrum sp. AD140]MDZ5810802.1 hypothetical protein [Halorubrum sp. AD140]
MYKGFASSDYFRSGSTSVTLCTDSIVAVYEQDAGGEIIGLRKISTRPYFAKSYELPRDYAWMTAQKLATEADVIAAVATIYFSDDLDEATSEEELDSLVTAANKNEIDISTLDIRERLKDRDHGEDVPSFIQLGVSQRIQAFRTQQPMSCVEHSRQSPRCRTRTPVNLL